MARDFKARSLIAGLILAAVLSGCESDDAGLAAGPPPPPPPPPPVEGDCMPGKPEVVLTGEVAESDAKTYRMLPFTVGSGTGRVEAWYRWTENPGPPGTPVTNTTLDLGLWDERGYRTQAAFRGWGGSRQGRSEDKPVFVQADIADRGFTPGAIGTGTWNVELGIAAVSPQGATWEVHITCEAAEGTAPTSDPADADHVASLLPGWYHSDFHMHAYHSNPRGPEWDDFVAQARLAELDFLMVTEYVTGRHWDQLGAVQRAHPDLLIWPGREIITYFGHVNTHGETFGFHEYRHGFEDVDLRDIQIAAKAAGALFQVNHPTLFPPPAFENFCRGCYFELGDVIDWADVDTIEILTGPVHANSTDAGAPPFPGTIENPFMQTAIDLWEDLLTQGYKITAVSGSDFKGVEGADDPAERERVGYGSSATAVYASALSRAALTEALRAGRAYVRTEGVRFSPALEFTATAGADEVMFGGTLTVGPADPATLRTVVTGGAGEALRYLVNGTTFAEVPVLTDPFVHTLTVARSPDEGPLGTFWRVETFTPEIRTAIGNPIFLKE